MVMSEQRDRGDQLLNGISEQAEAEAGRIADEAETQALEIVKNAKRKARGIIEESFEKGDREVETLRRKNEQNIEAEQRKRRLKAREELFSLTLNRIREGLRDLITGNGYRDVLRGWIVEGALGLGREDLIVNASAAERALLDQELLKQAEIEVEKRTGRNVRIALSPDEPMQKQGIFMTTADGRLAFNNGVEARLQRYSTVIRRMIYQQIQADTKEK